MIKQNHEKLGIVTGYRHQKKVSLFFKNIKYAK